MKILIYSHYFLPSVGGVERVVESLARGFSERGHAVTVATATPAGRAADADLPYRVIRRPGMPSLMRLIREHDIAHLAGPALLPMFLAWLLRRPFAIEHHSFQSICPNGQMFYQPQQAMCPGHFLAGHYGECVRCNAWQGRLRALRMCLSTFPRRWLCHRATMHVMPTHWLASQLRLAPDVTILHGVESAPEALDSSSSSPVPCYAFLGRLVTTKGLKILLDAAGKLAKSGFNFEIKIVGGGPERSRWETVAKEGGLADRLIFLGRLTSPQVEQALQDVCAVIVPSLAGEVFGLTAVEQMLRGRPVIVADLGPFVEVVGDAGLVFKAGDAVALAACMRRVWEEAGLAARLGEKGRARAIRLFGRERMVGEHLQLYTSILR